MLLKLLKNIDLSQFEMHVLCLTGSGRIGNDIRALDVPVTLLELTSLLDALKAVVRVRRYIKGISPHILHGWMYHGNLAAWFCRFFIGPSVHVVWGVRQSLYDLSHQKRSTSHVIRFCASISKTVSKILYNSRLARQHHENIGYFTRLGETIPNGFDTSEYRPDSDAPGRLRAELKLPTGAQIVGMVARLDPMKGHVSFLRAAALIAVKSSTAHFVMVGRGVDATSPCLENYVNVSSLKGRVHFLGERADISKLFPGFDVAVTPSVSEGFANVIGEAMSCGVPCVVTDVGDSAMIVANCGRVVAVDDTEALSQSVYEILQMPVVERVKLGMRGRQRVLDEFSISSVADRYTRLYQSLCWAGEGG